MYIMHYYSAVCIFYLGGFFLIFSSHCWAVHVSWSKCCLYVCLCVWMLTNLAQIITAEDRLVILRAQTCYWALIAHQKLDHSAYFTGQNHPPEKMCMNRHFKPAEPHSPWYACFVVIWSCLNCCTHSWRAWDMASRMLQQISTYRALWFVFYVLCVSSI